MATQGYKPQKDFHLTLQRLRGIRGALDIVVKGYSDFGHDKIRPLIGAESQDGRIRGAPLLGDYVQFYDVPATKIDDNAVLQRLQQASEIEMMIAYFFQGVSPSAAAQRFEHADKRERAFIQLQHPGVYERKKAQANGK